MDKYFFHPLGDNAPEYTAFYTYSGHGIGNLDYGVAAGTPVYAMCDGTISYCGWGTTIYSRTKEPNTYCVLQCKADNNNLNENFYIRYLHGDYSVKTGDLVKKGLLIGTIASHGNSTGPHLHIDFTLATPPSAGPADAPRDPAVAGLLSLENNKYYFIYDNKRYLINNNTHIEKVIEWRNKNGGGMDVGYCWLVFAQSPLYLTPSVEPEGGIPINREIYDNNAGTQDNLDAVLAYFNATFTESFFGPPPKTWDDFLNNWNLRCLTDFCKRETGIWPFASAVYAKIIRADILGLYYLNLNCINGRQYDTFQEWWRAVIYGSNGGWIGSYSINDGTNCISGDSPLTGTDNDLKYVQAIYNNFRYKDIYGASLHTGSQEFKDKIIMMANGLCSENYYDYNTGKYNGGPLTFVINYKPGSTYFRFVAYRNETESIGGSYNLHAYILP